MSVVLCIPLRRVYLGTWGDADPFNLNAWAEVVVEPPENKMEWSDELQTCDEVITGFTYELLTSKVGAASNPQKQVKCVRC